MLFAATFEVGSFNGDKRKLPSDGHGSVVLGGGECVGLVCGELAAGVFGERHKVLDCHVGFGVAFDSANDSRGNVGEL